MRNENAEVRIWVYERIREAGHRGLIAEDLLEMAELEGMHPQSITMRPAELKDAGLIVDDRGCRVARRSGREQKVLYAKGFEPDPKPEPQLHMDDWFFK
jgi:hypothetical protein